MLYWFKCAFRIFRCFDYEFSRVFEGVLEVRGLRFIRALEFRLRLRAQGLKFGILLRAFRSDTTMGIYM